MNELKVFENHEFGQVRTTEENGKVFFCGSDVAKALGYTNAPDAIARHCRAIVKRDTPVSGKIQSINFIPEGDVYRLITHSKMPNAERFEQWVFDDVLPTIRKTGGYVSNDDLFINTYLPNADEATRMLFKNTLSTVRELNTKIEVMKPKALFADAVSVSDSCILIGVLAKLLKQNGIAIGQNRLFQWLRTNKYLTRDNTPTQKAMELGLFKQTERTVRNPDGSIRITRTTLVTGKGQQYFINKFLSQ